MTGKVLEFAYETRGVAGAAKIVGRYQVTTTEEILPNAVVVGHIVRTEKGRLVVVTENGSAPLSSYFRPKYLS